MSCHLNHTIISAMRVMHSTIAQNSLKNYCRKMLLFVCLFVFVLSFKSVVKIEMTRTKTVKDRLFGRYFEIDLFKV